MTCRDALRDLRGARWTCMLEAIPREGEMVHEFVAVDAIASDERPMLVIVASADAGKADRLVASARQRGMYAYAAQSFRGCLRIATSVRPDVIVLDRSLPDRLARLLKAHPLSASARFVRLL